MGFFSKIFGSSTAEIEKELQDEYIPMFQTMMNMSSSEADSTFRDLLKQGKVESTQDGTSNLPENLGDSLLERESTDESIGSMLAKARKEGATDEDIKWWWNLHDLERRMMLKVDDLQKTALYI